MHGLRRKTEIRRLNLDKVKGEQICAPLSGPDALLTRRVRLTIPAGVVVLLSFTQKPNDITNGVQSYDWPELEGPQNNLVFSVLGNQEVWAMLSTASPDGLAPHCSAIIEYPSAVHPE